MDNKVVLISGATDGIGKQTALKLAAMGARVIVHGRNRSRGATALQEIGEKTGKEARFVQADLSSLKNVTGLAEDIKKAYDRIDVLINNAGVFQREQVFSDDGYEMTFAVNHLAHFALSLQLLPLLKESAQGRIINVSSMAHRSSPRTDFSDIHDINAYMDYSAYSLSKLANVLFSNELASRLKATKITSNSLHPGVITTKLLREGFGISGNDVEQGCLTSVYLASEESLSSTSGKYFSNSRETEPSPYAFDPELRNNLWNLSEELTGVKFNDFV
ncbi:MAG: SDR family oxidoreductase [Bacteroidales bacterium]|jgi:NAD(P)-dependent dehydrogenase (short-subunit alcohol dehydrogenase family)|nr:SDR family oxidoreductase [Bacteroidales bacterium]